MPGMLVAAIVAWIFCMFKSIDWNDYEGALLTFGTSIASGIITYYILCY